MTRIVVADDHPIFREGLKRVLEAQADFAVVGEAGDGIQALRVVKELHPDILLLDLDMPTLGGLEVLRRLSLKTHVRTVVLTAGVDTSEVLAAMDAGAYGVLLKGSPVPLLYESVRCVMAGQYWVDGGKLRDITPAMRPSNTVPRQTPEERPFRLTKRELDVIAGIVAGESNKEIASRLHLGDQTVKHHLSNIFEKLGVSSRLELAVFAIYHGLARPGRRT